MPENNDNNPVDGDPDSIIDSAILEELRERYGVVDPADNPVDPPQSEAEKDSSGATADGNNSITNSPNDSSPETWFAAKNTETEDLNLFLAELATYKVKPFENSYSANTDNSGTAIVMEDTTESLKGIKESTIPAEESALTENKTPAEPVSAQAEKSKTNKQNSVFTGDSNPVEESEPSVEPEKIKEDNVEKYTPSYRIIYDSSVHTPASSPPQPETISNPQDELQKSEEEVEIKKPLNESLSNMRIIYEAPEESFVDSTDELKEDPVISEDIIESDNQLTGSNAVKEDNPEAQEEVNASFPEEEPSVLPVFSNISQISKDEGESEEDNNDTISFNKPKHKKKLSVFVCLILTVAIVLGFGFTAYNYYSFKGSEEQAQETVKNNSDINTGSIPIVPEPIMLLKPDTADVSYPEGILEKYKPLYAFNPDVVGWLRIPNTSIDTVVTKYKNNNYYLKMDFYGKNNLGNAFLDYRNGTKELSQNSIIYGHATRSGLQVFYDLYKYTDYDFYVNNPVIEFGTIYADYQWKVFSAFITTVEKGDDNGYYFYYIHPEIDSSKFSGYLDQIIQRSRYFTDIGLTDDDKILTLSTCIHVNDFAGRTVNTRLVIAARLLREGESKETDLAKVTDNPNFRRPQVWYDYFGKSNPYSNSERWTQ